MQYSLPMACLKAETELAIRWSAAGDYAASSPPKIGGENLSARHFADIDSGGFCIGNDRRTREKKSKRRAMAKAAIRNAGAFVGVLMRKTIPMKVIE